MRPRMDERRNDWKKWALPPLGVPLTVLAAMLNPLLGAAVLIATLFAVVAVICSLVFGARDLQPDTRGLLLLWNASPLVLFLLLVIDW